MRAIWIDAVHRTVTEVIVTNLDEMQEKIGGLICMAAEDEDNGDTLYVDDEGLLKDPKDFFLLKFFRHHPFAGNGLIVGVDKETGESVDAKVPLEIVKKNVFFMDRNAAFLWYLINQSKN